ncbi:MAG: hypothetical protein KKC51_12110 [Verrucomicrobia bacterium]|nr:hypothetical protein [Verrucomicrobiota bacterium]
MKGKCVWRCGAAGLGLLAQVLGAEARLWTSQAGSQVEAEFVEMQAGFVVLRATDGRQFKIQMTQLSADDQVFLRENHLRPAAPPEAAPVAPVSAPVSVPAPATPPPSAASATEAGDTNTSTAWLVYAAPDPLPADQFPGLAGTNLPRTMLVGIQFGPAKTDVLYCAFESPDPQEPPSLLYLYSPSAEGFTRTVTRPGMRRKVEETRISSFRDIRLKSAFGDIRMAADLEFSCGFGRSDTVLLLATIQLSGAGQTSALLLGGMLNNDFIYGAGTLNVFPLLTRPELSVKTWMMRGPALTGFCQMGRLSLVPKSGMGSALALEVVERDSGRVLDRMKTEINEKKLVAGQPDRTIFQSLSLQAGKKVLIKAILDLGPFFGKVEKSSNFY